MTDTLTIRPLAEADLPLLFSWLNEGHLRPYYQRKPISIRDVEEKYLPRLSPDHPTHCLIAEANACPFGYLQWYFNRDFPEYGIDILAEPNGVSLDYFIGDPDYLGRRLGDRMLRAAIASFGQNIAAEDALCFVGHHRNNRSAISCSKRAGFTFRKHFIEEDEEHVLLTRGMTEGPLTGNRA